MQCLCAAFESLGLARDPARVLVALLQYGPATPDHLAGVAGIDPHRVGEALGKLGSLGIVACRIGAGSLLWAPVGRVEVIARLVEAGEDRLAAMRARAARAAELTERLIPIPHRHTRRGDFA